jgi:hypothetical protein
MTARTRGAAGLPAALMLLAVSTAMSAAFLELSHAQAVLAGMRRNAAVALATADGCLAAVVARLPAGWDFAAVQTAIDDGSIDVAPPCSLGAAAAPDPARLLVDVEATANVGRRRVAAVVNRAASPGGDALIWLARDAPEDVAGHATLDGVDVDDPARPPVASIAGPGLPEMLDAWLAAQGSRVDVTAPDARPRFAPPPPLAEIDARAVAAGAAGGGTFVPSGPAPPVLTRIGADLVVDTPLRGAGLLVVQGRLDILSAFDFTGVVVAAGGVRVVDGASLIVRGALWTGPDDPGVPMLDVAGELSVGASAAAVDLADSLLPLPRRARIAGVSDPP